MVACIAVWNKCRCVTVLIILEIFLIMRESNVELRTLFISNKPVVSLFVTYDKTWLRNMINLVSLLIDVSTMYSLVIPEIECKNELINLQFQILQVFDCNCICRTYRNQLLIANYIFKNKNRLLLYMFL